MDRELPAKGQHSKKRLASSDVEDVQASEFLHIPEKKKPKQTVTNAELLHVNVPFEVALAQFVPNQSKNPLCNGSLCDDILSYILSNYVTRFVWIKHMWLTGDIALQHKLSRIVTTVIFPKFEMKFTGVAPELRLGDKQIAYLSAHFPNIHSISINLDRNLTLLPSKLKSLTAESYVDTIDASILPSTITSLRLIGTRIDGNDLKSKLSLSSLKYDRKSSYAHVLSSPSLTWLDCTTANLEEQNLIIHNLESFYCSIDAFSDWKKGMPPVISTLILTQSRVYRSLYVSYGRYIPNIIALLPQSLTSLSIQFEYQDEIPDIAPLPRQLTRLNFPALNQIGILLTCCPSSIKEIVHRIPIQSPSEMALLAAGFPKLTSLAINASWFSGPNGCVAVLDLSNLTDLMRLDMVIKPHKSNGSISFTPSFPPKLQSLTIKTLKQFRLTRRFIRCLPRNLFHFYAVGYQGTSRFFHRILIDDIYILDSLPKTICEMAIDSDKRLQDFNDVIPPNLHTFYSCKYRQADDGEYMHQTSEFRVNQKSKFNFNIPDKYGGDRFKTYKLEGGDNCCERTITILGAFGGEASLDDFGSVKDFKFDL